jgi:hypothetical protein
MVYLGQAGKYDAGKYSFADVLTIGFLNTAVLLTNNDHYVVCGQVILYLIFSFLNKKKRNQLNFQIILLDLQALTMAHLVQATPLELKRSLQFNKDAIPIRQKSIHFINAPSIFTSMYNTIKTLMPQKLRDRVRFLIMYTIFSNKN